MRRLKAILAAQRETLCFASATAQGAIAGATLGITEMLQQYAADPGGLAPDQYASLAAVGLIAGGVGAWAGFLFAVTVGEMIHSRRTRHADPRADQGD